MATSNFTSPSPSHALNGQTRLSPPVPCIYTTPHTQPVSPYKTSAPNNRSMPSVMMVCALFRGGTTTLLTRKQSNHVQSVNRLHHHSVSPSHLLLASFNKHCHNLPRYPLPHPIDLPAAAATSHLSSTQKGQIGPPPTPNSIPVQEQAGLGDLRGDTEYLLCI
jgi:hypothetical protein